MTINKIAASFKSAYKETYTVIKKTVLDPYGQYYISELALSVFALAKDLGQTIPVPIQNGFSVLRTYTDFTCSVTLAGKIAALVNCDSKGRRVWQRPLHKAVYQFLYMINDAANCVYFLDTIKLMSLGRFLLPFGYFDTALKLSIYSLEIYNYGRSINKSIGKKREAHEKIRVWKKRTVVSPQQWEALAAEKIAKWSAKETRAQNDYEKKHAALVKKHWVKIQKKSPMEISKMKVTKWQTVKTNCLNKIKKSWAAVACDVLYIACLIFITAAELFALKLALPIGIAALALNAIYIAYVVFEKCHDKKKVKISYH